MASGVAKLQEIFPWRGEWRVRVATSPREAAGIDAEEAKREGIRDHHLFTLVFRTTRDGKQEADFRPILLPYLDAVDEIAWHQRHSAVLGEGKGEAVLIENFGKGWRRSELPPGWQRGQRARLLVAPDLLCLWRGDDLFIRRNGADWEKMQGGLPEMGEDGRSKGIFHGGFLVLGIRNDGTDGLFRAPANLPPGTAFERIATGEFSGLATLEDGRLLAGFDAPSSGDGQVGLFELRDDGSLVRFDPESASELDPSAPVLSLAPATGLKSEAPLVASRGTGVFRISKQGPQRILSAFDEEDGIEARPVLLGENTAGEVILGSPRYGLLSPPKKTLEVRAAIDDPFLPIESDPMAQLVQQATKDFFASRLRKIPLPDGFRMERVPAADAARRVAELLESGTNERPVRIETAPALLESAAPFSFQPARNSAHAQALVEALATALKARVTYRVEDATILLDTQPTQ